jgi:hypothetical protein
MFVAHLLRGGEIAGRLHCRHWIRAIQREREETAQVVPHRFELYRGGDVAVVPEQTDHLTEDANSAPLGSDEGSDSRLKVVGIERASAPEHVECLACVETAVAAAEDEIADRKTIARQGSLYRGTMSCGRDAHDDFVPTESLAEELGNRGNQFVVAVVKADEMFVALGTRSLRESIHGATVAFSVVAPSSLAATVRISPAR